MKNRRFATLHSPNDSTEEEFNLSQAHSINRRSFLRNSVVASAAVTLGAGVLADIPSALGQQSD